MKNIGCEPSSVVLKKGEELHDLQTHNLHLIQSKAGYCFNQDSVLLANFVVAKKTDIVCDLCAGNGIVGILVTAKNNNKKTICVELQKQLFSLAERNILCNNLHDKITAINTPVQEIDKLIATESVDIVTVNPPYFKSSDPVCKIEEIAIARTELTVNLDEIVFASSKILKSGGKLYIVQQASRLSETMKILHKHRFEPKLLRLVQPKQNTEPNIFLLQATKGGKEYIKILPTLVVFDELGNETQEIKQIYNRK